MDQRTCAFMEAPSQVMLFSPDCVEGNGARFWVTLDAGFAAAVCGTSGCAAVLRGGLGASVHHRGVPLKRLHHRAAQALSVVCNATSRASRPSQSENTRRYPHTCHHLHWVPGRRRGCHMDTSRGRCTQRWGRAHTRSAVTSPPNIFLKSKCIQLARQAASSPFCVNVLR